MVGEEPYQRRPCRVKGQRFLRWGESLKDLRGFGWSGRRFASWKRRAHHLDVPRPSLRRRDRSQRSNNVDWLGAVWNRAWPERQHLFAGVRKLKSEKINIENLRLIYAFSYPTLHYRGHRGGVSQLSMSKRRG